ncbi:MAG TPA: enoyl-CoA hydratase [Rhodopseudomonas sp.]|uniref:enoyl-CoA hydratase n=1 Tax=Rhodopseudomonas sp. TaxID=1078 RepID=UPI002ED97E45
MTAQPAYVATPHPPILLRETIDGGLAVLTLNRPAQRNSLSKDLIGELQAALDSIAHDDGVRVVVVAANGPAFCAGHDLKEITAHRNDPDQGRACFARLMTACSAMMQSIVALPKPVIAAVQGVATAAGCQLVASCDLAVASDDASFATPGVDIGLFCSTPMVALLRNVAPKHAMDMLLTGEPVGAEAARAIGLINRVVAAGQARDAAIALGRGIARKSAHTVRIGKAAFYRQAEMDLAEAYRFAAEVMTENLMSEDADEGIRAFIDKRDPVWKDR